LILIGSSLQLLSQQQEIPPKSPQEDKINAGKNVITEGRTAENRKKLLAQFGGTEKTEESVHRALLWLKKQQDPKTGAWSLVGPYKDGATYENPVAATAMALLAFQGQGNTDTSGEFKDIVAKGWTALLKMQDKDGLFSSPSMANQNQGIYSHGMAMIAICEIYAMTQNEKYKNSAQLAIDYAAKTQDPKNGGWRYLPGNDSDTSVTGWITMGLRTGKLAGLKVPDVTLRNVDDYLDKAQRDGGATYNYRPGYNSITAATSATGLLMRQYSGWKKDDERLRNGVQKIIGYPIDPNDWKTYYWYHATQVCHHMEGDAWKEWNRVMREILPDNQIKKGPDEGSWGPEADEWGHLMGRLGMTCFCTLMLESYYRHIPIYSK
jgi:hypothetical protein